MKERMIRTGDIVQRVSSKGLSKHKSKQLGIVGYAPYSVDLASVVWERRATHEVIRKSLLKLVITKKQAHSVRKLVARME